MAEQVRPGHNSPEPSQAPERGPIRSRSRFSRRAQTAYWLSYASVLGVAVGISASELGAVDAAKNFFSGDDGVAKTALLPEQLYSMAQESGLSSEVIDEVSRNLIRFQVTTVPGYESYKFGDFSCNGFVIRDGKGTALFVTAKHCWPDSIRSGQDGIAYATLDDKGHSILKATIVGGDGGKRDLRVDNYDPGEQSKEPNRDVVTFKLSSGDEVDVPGLIMNKEANLEKGEIVYRISLGNDGGVNIFPLRVLNQADGKIGLLGLSNGSRACISGTSGSAIVNSRGELVGIVSMGTTFVLSSDYVKSYTLDESLVGSVAGYCAANDTSVIDGLVRY